MSVVYRCNRCGEVMANRRGRLHAYPLEPQGQGHEVDLCDGCYNTVADDLHIPGRRFPATGTRPKGVPDERQAKAPRRYWWSV